MRLLIRCPDNFSFWSSVWSSGWSMLAPFHADDKRKTVQGILQCEQGEVVWIRMYQKDKGHVEVLAKSHGPMPKNIRDEVQKQVETCLRLDQDYSSFRQLLKEEQEFRWILEKGAGRIFRSPTVFEDVVKTILSTNCRWVQTKKMAKQLCSKLGEPYSNGHHAFPTPEKLASAGASFLKEEIRVGYRAQYLVELAGRVSSGELSIEEWRGSPLKSPDLARTIRRLKGVGDWSTKNILHLLGRYDCLAIDSWVRSQFSRIHAGGRPVSDGEIEKYYERFGEWRGLILWLDMVKEYLT